MAVYFIAKPIGETTSGERYYRTSDINEAAFWHEKDSALDALETCVGSLACYWTVEEVE